MVVEPPGFFVPEGARHTEHDWSHAATGAKFPAPPGHDQPRERSVGWAGGVSAAGHAVLGVRIPQVGGSLPVFARCRIVPGL